jgi:hypothetical protein
MLVDTPNDVSQRSVLGHKRQVTVSPEKCHIDYDILSDDRRMPELAKTSPGTARIPKWLIETGLSVFDSTPQVYVFQLGDFGLAERH